ncbi:hypothetical protein PENSPDRAFT_671765 [Peniophora sp. CONT]|nr:hypothetical protein PENSPDRAFT_671765 [Peniophora sp. CONT]
MSMSDSYEVRYYNFIEQLRDRMLRRSQEIAPLCEQTHGSRHIWIFTGIKSRIRELQNYLEAEIKHSPVQVLHFDVLHYVDRYLELSKPAVGPKYVWQSKLSSVPTKHMQMGTAVKGDFQSRPTLGGGKKTKGVQTGRELEGYVSEGHKCDAEALYHYAGHVPGGIDAMDIDGCITASLTLSSLSNIISRTDLIAASQAHNYYQRYE